MNIRERFLVAKQQGQQYRYDKISQKEQMKAERLKRVTQDVVQVRKRLEAFEKQNILPILKAVGDSIAVSDVAYGKGLHMRHRIPDSELESWQSELSSWQKGLYGLSRSFIGSFEYIPEQFSTEDFSGQDWFLDRVGNDNRNLVLSSSVSWNSKSWTEDYYLNGDTPDRVTHGTYDAIKIEIAEDGASRLIRGNDLCPVNLPQITDVLWQEVAVEEISKVISQDNIHYHY